MPASYKWEPFSCLLYCSVNTEPEYETDDSKAKLQERRPTVSNKDELLALMAATHKQRRNWITKKSPTITEILQRYPRLAGMPDAVSLSCLEL